MDDHSRVDDQNNHSQGTLLTVLMTPSPRLHHSPTSKCRPCRIPLSQMAVTDRDSWLGHLWRGRRHDCLLLVSLADSLLNSSVWQDRLLQATKQGLLSRIVTEDFNQKLFHWRHIDPRKHPWQRPCAKIFPSLSSSDGPSLRSVSITAVMRPIDRILSRLIWLFVYLSVCLSVSRRRWRQLE